LSRQNQQQAKKCDERFGFHASELRALAERGKLRLFDEV